MSEPDGSHGELAPAVRLDQGHIEGTGGLPARFPNPGLPPHVARMADLDEKAAKRAEKQVATMFGLSSLATIVFVVAYFAIDPERGVFLPGLGETSLYNVVLGVSFAVALLGIGMGAVHWAKTRMPDSEMVEERHPLRASDVDRKRVVDNLMEGGDAAQISRRPLIKYSLVGGLALFPVALLLPLVGGLGPLPKDVQEITVFSAGLQAGAKEVEAAKALVKFITAPAAASAYTKRGLEPG